LNTISLADGSMDKSLFVNPETGYLERIEEDPKAKKAMIDDVYTTEEIAEYEKNYIPKLITTPFNEIKFAGYEDTTHHNMGGKYRDSGTKFGAGGIVWDESHEMGVRADIAQDVSEMSEPAFRSWFFGGTQYKYTDSGKNFMTPAQDFIAQKYPSYEPGTTEYEGALNTLKLQDLSSPEYQQFAIQSFLDINKQFHETAFETQKEKNKKVYKATISPAEKNLLVDGVSYGYDHSKELADRMYKGENTQYSLDKNQNTKYVQDGKGYTTVYEKQTINDLVKGDDGEMYVKGTREEYVRVPGKITTEAAANKRGLGSFPSGYIEKKVEEKPSQTYVPKAANTDDARLQKDLAWQLRKALPNDPRNF